MQLPLIHHVNVEFKVLDTGLGQARPRYVTEATVHKVLPLHYEVGVSELDRLKV